MTADDVARQAHAAWPISLAKASTVDVLIAVLDGQPLMAWGVLGAYASQETYDSNGGPRARVAFALGSPVPVDPSWHEVPSLRRGVATETR